MVRTKVFVGNLSFKTEEADLAKEFAVAGKVATANIISRGSRSLGYGFVEFETLEEANKAVELLNKKLIDNREINVEVARPRDETAPKEPRAPRAPRARAPRAPKAAGAEGQAQPAGEGAAPRARNPRQRRPRQPRNKVAGEGAAAAPKDGAPAAAPKAPREKRVRQPKPEGERAPRIASPNTLFVANLPFSVDDAGLTEIFAGLNLKSAHVVRKRNNRSKGFGFVEFNNAEDQAKALTAVDKKKVDERELIVKVAETQQKEAAGVASPKPAAASPAPVAASPKAN